MSSAGRASQSPEAAMLMLAGGQIRNKHLSEYTWCSARFECAPGTDVTGCQLVASTHWMSPPLIQSSGAGAQFRTMNSV